MKGQLVRIICTGRLKQGLWQEAWAHYLKQARKWREVEIVEIRDASATLSLERRIEEEATKIRKCLTGKDAVIALSEEGEQFTSPAFASFLNRLAEQEQKTPTFIIGGPFGLSPAIQQNAFKLLSLSSMTWPHELARVLLLEQIFRADCILNRFPYHH